MSPSNQVYTPGNANVFGQEVSQPTSLGNFVPQAFPVDITGQPAEQDVPNTISSLQDSLTASNEALQASKSTSPMWRMQYFISVAAFTFSASGFGTIVCQAGTLFVLATLDGAPAGAWVTTPPAPVPTSKVVFGLDYGMQPVGPAGNVQILHTWTAGPGSNLKVGAIFSTDGSSALTSGGPQPPASIYQVGGPWGAFAATVLIEIGQNPPVYLVV